MYRFSTLPALFTIAILVAPWAPIASADPDDLEALDFLAGAWGTDEGVVELWLPPLRGLMVGINRSTGGSGMPMFEYLRIEARTDGIFYVASPRGTGTTEFELTEVSDVRAVFENPRHDFPQKIIYTRDGDRLEAEVGATQDGEWSSFNLKWQALPCAAAD